MTRVTADDAMPWVSVIVPCRNERGHVEQFVASLQSQDYARDRIEFLIADGMSTDGTRERLDALALADPRVVALDNPGLSVSTGLNRAIARARGDIVVRMDVHTEYAPDYVSRCVEELGATGAACVGGAWRAEGETYLQRAVAAGFRSSFGSGGARSHAQSYTGEVDSVYLGCWRRETLVAAGMFDEELVRNQDDELCLRLQKAGGRIWQSSAIRSVYRPRASLAALFRQYFQYGYWKVRVIRKHGQPAALRHLVPATAVLLGVALLVAAPFSGAAAIALLVLAGSYCALLLAASLASCAASGEWDLLPVLPAVFIAYHAGYGLGFCRGLVDFVLLRRATPASATRLTR